MSIKRLIAGLAATPLVAALAMPLTAFAATTITVTPLNTQGWSTADTAPGGEVNYVTDTTATGGSALQLKTDATTSAKAQYMHGTNTKLSDVNTLSYVAKQVSASSPQGQASYQLPVLVNGTTGFTTFVYEPYIQSPPVVVTPGNWQTFDVSAGQFWSTRNVTCGSNTITAGHGGAPFYTLADIQSMCPDAVAIGYGVNVGTYNSSYNIYVDSLTFNDTTYNFRQAVTPSNKDACKNDGWMSFNAPTFKNQGDCVSFVASAKTSTYKLDSASQSGLNVPTTKGAYYQVTVEGTWTNRPGEVVDAECTNMQSGTWQNAVNATGDTTYSPDLLDTQINKQFVDWGPCEPTTHSYTKWVVADGDNLNLRVFDGDTSTNTQIPDWYHDNNGSLNVTIVAHKI